MAMEKQWQQQEWEKHEKNGIKAIAGGVAHGQLNERRAEVNFLYIAWYMVSMIFK